MTLKLKEGVTPKEVRHGVVNRQQPAGVQEEDVAPTDENRVSGRRRGSKRRRFAEEDRDDRFLRIQRKNTRMTRQDQDKDET